MSRFDKVAKQWDAKSRRIFMAKNTFEEIKKKFFLTKDMKVLDIGAGTGLLLLNFVDKVKHITGIDNSQGMLDVLKEKLENSHINNVNIQYFDANKDTLHKKEYNLAISNMTFHHFIRPENFIKQVYDSLDIKGRICIADLETEDGTFHSKENLEGVYHFGFDKKIFLNWLKQANFKNISTETIFKINKNGKKFPVFLAYGEKE